MPKHTFIPNKDILAALKAKQSKPFSVVDIRDSLLKISTMSNCPSALRRWVNGQFQTLIRHKYIEVTKLSGKKKLYRNTNLTLSFQVDTDKKACSVDSAKELFVTVDELKERLKNYKVELLSFVGEKKEYEELSKLYPDLRQQLQARFNIAQEKHLEYKGRINAVESLLSEQLL